MRNIPSTDLAVHPLCLGGNVFGWTADEAESFAVLDAYAAAGGNFVDTADGYSRGSPATAAASRRRSSAAGWPRAATATRSSSRPRSARRATARAWRADNVRVATEESLRRLQTDRIDLLYTHRDDEVTPPEETLGAFDELVREGKVRHVAASNFSPGRLAEALAASAREGLVRYVALQPHYNLVERDYEDGLADVCRRHDLGVPAVLRAGQGLPDRQVPARRRRRPEPARARAPRLPRRARRARARRARRGRGRARRRPSPR